MVAVDLRGVGGSDAATLVRDLHGVIDHLGGGPVHVVGHDALIERHTARG